MYKRVCAALLALALCVGVLLPDARAADPIAEYADLDGTAWYTPGVRFCLDKQLMTGYGKRVRIFAPGAPTTRAQIVTILWRIAGKPKASGTLQYYDVPEGEWYTDAVRWAHAKNVMSGYNRVQFGPDDPVTREQLALLLWRFTKYYNGSIPPASDRGFESFNDVGEVSGFAEEAMRWTYGMGIMTGMRNRYGIWLKPGSESSRAVVATVLMRYCLDMGVYD